MARRSDQEIRDDLAAKIAKIDEREANKKAREASKEVRKLERDEATVLRFIDEHYAGETLEGALADVRLWLKEARAAAVKP